MRIAPALLEEWLREYYFDVDYDLGCSGVENFSWAELRSLTGIDAADLDTVVFHDSHTRGAPLLRQAIADRWGTGDPGRVMATHGSSEAMYLVIKALVEPGDEVVALWPCYQPLYAIAEAAGGSLKRWEMRAERQYVPDLDELRALVTARTRLVIVNFPHNPTGATLTASQWRELVAIVSTHGAYLLWDAAFAELTYDEPPLPDPGVDYDRCLTLGTLSKAYGLPGLRVGWCLGAPDVLDRCVHLRDYITLHLSPLVELIAERAVRDAGRLLEPRLRQARANRDRLAAWVDDHARDVSWARPRGGVSSFVRLDAVPDVTRFCRELAAARKVLLCPGECFGDPRRVRLGFGCASAVLDEGLTRLAAHLEVVSV